MARPPRSARHSRLPAWIQRIDEALADRRNLRWAPRPVDRTLRGLSHRADHGVLWFVIAGVLLVLGGRPERRAAVRGLASLGVASLLANVVGKRLFGGSRPLLDQVPFRRRLRRTPVSPSLPSGHSASAAAFVLGAGLESRNVGLALAPLALGVGYSRLHTGAHWFSDVVAGLGLGSAVALLGAPILRRVDPPAGPVVELPAIGRGRGMLLVVNPSSGEGKLRIDPIAELRRELTDAEIVEVDEVSTPRSLRRALRRADARVLGACGGDGTIAMVARVAAEEGLPLFVAPGGTLNHFARAAGIPDLAHALRGLRAGTGVAASVGLLEGGRVVLNTLALGVYPRLVEERERRERVIGKWPAAVVAGARVLREGHPIEVSVNGARRRIWLMFVGIGRYAPRTLLPLRRERVDDGVLDARIVRADVPLAGLRMIVALLLGNRIGDRLGRIPAVRRALGLELTESRSLRIDAGDEPIATDGEVEEHAGRFRVDISPVPLLVYAPVPRGRRGRER